MTAVLDRLLQRNPLLGHGPRTHASGIALPTEVPPPKRRVRRPAPDAPRLHLGADHR